MKTTKTAAQPAPIDLATLTRWCRARRRNFIDDCGEVDVTALALACAEAHGDDHPGEHHPCWTAATSAFD